MKVAILRSADVSPLCASTPHSRSPKVAAPKRPTIDEVTSQRWRRLPAEESRCPTISRPLSTKKRSPRWAPPGYVFASDGSGPVVHEYRFPDPVLDLDLLEREGYVLSQQVVAESLLDLRPARVRQR